MSDTDGKKPLGLGGGAQRPGQVKQSFSHGRTKSVVVETKRRGIDPALQGQTGADDVGDHRVDGAAREWSVAHQVAGAGA